MQKHLLVLLLFLFCQGIQAQNASIHLIPQPVSLKVNGGNFQLTEQTMIQTDGNEESKKVAEWLQKFLQKATAYPLKITSGNAADHAIHIAVQSDNDATIGKEGYHLTVTAQKIDLNAREGAGLFYGMQTLLHLHLTDDQGWRIEIKSLPKLTAVGAWRVPRTGLWGERQPLQEGEEATDGGFYTQEQIRELVQYAADRHVQILPEIDVPGHSLAAINYAQSFYDAIIQPLKDDRGQLQIKLDTELAGLQMYYTFDNTYPDDHAKAYQAGEALSIPKDADTFRVVTYRSGNPLGRIIRVPIADLEKRVSK